MKLTFSKKVFSLFLIMIFITIIGCFSDKKKDKNKEKLAAARAMIPATETMNIDFSSFNTISKKYIARVDSTPGVADIDLNEAACWTIGFVMVSWSNVVCFAPLAIPIAIFTVLRNQIPTVYTPTYFKWSYSHNGNTAVIVAEKRGGTYDWEWSVTINNFEWITGGSKADKTSGWWQFHDPYLASASKNSIRVDWTYTDDLHKSVVFTNNDDTALTTKYGDKITYTRTVNDVSVRFYDVKSDVSGGTDNGGTKDIEVYWDLSTKIGGITDYSTPSSCTWNPTD